jgi:serine-type D-Ala-D-Ala carboxypeptidase/endopeptidase (penicillin-binding protein 4)
MPVSRLRHALLATCAGLVTAFTTAVAAAAPRDLPPTVERALEAAQVPREAMVAVVQELGRQRPLVAWQPDLAANPASLMKLFTSFAALELLGPAWSWTTPVWLQGPVKNGVLEGNLVIKGSGDPKLVQERLWLLLRRVQQAGVREIRGDIVLDRSAFSGVDASPAAFDGEPLRAHNVQADALLLNFKTLTLTFTPDAIASVARVTAEPALGEAPESATLPLTTAPCDDWRAVVLLDVADTRRFHFGGGFPQACGERQWTIADPEPRSYNARLLSALWRDLGGSLAGTVRDGLAPTMRPSFELSSPPLAEVVRDINKFSNNVMAQQLFLTLGLVQRGSGTPQAARAVLRQWASERFGNGGAALLVDNGSGLSRDGRVSARLLARLLQAVWASPLAPELLASLPLAGVDGTLRKARSAVGRAHLKTGSLRDVVGIAGIVQSASGRRYAVVAVVNHANANEARPALEALVDWVFEDPVVRP